MDPHHAFHPLRATIAAGLLTLSACRSTTVTVAPHAGPGELAAGEVRNRSLGRDELEIGVLAVSEVRRGDFVWRVAKGGARVQLCQKTGCAEPKPVEGTKLPTRRLTFFESSEVRGTSPRAGVWMSGTSRFTPPFLYYCWVEGAQPMCEPAKLDGRQVLALGPLSTHTLRRGAETDDVAWVDYLFSVVRCRRDDRALTCGQNDAKDDP